MDCSTIACGFIGSTFLPVVRFLRFLFSFRVFVFRSSRRSLKHHGLCWESVGRRQGQFGCEYAAGCWGT